MKKIIIIIVAILTISLLLTACNVQASADSSAQVVDISASAQDASYILEQFLVNNSDRVYDTDGEYSAGQYISDAMQDIGIEVSSQKVSTSDNSYNIIGTIDAPDTDDCIIIGAHYDATGEGATDNGSGVTALLMIAELLYSNAQYLQCDIVLVAFAGEEAGLLGSYTYVNKMSDTQIANTKLMINIDSIAMGDNLMIYGENKQTDYVDALISSASSCTVDISYKPLYAGLCYAYDEYGYGYYDFIQNADHTPFALANIPTALYFSGSYDTFGNKYVESTVATNCVMNTDNDTWDTLVNSGILYADKIATVVTSVCSGIINEYDVLADASSEMVSELWYNAVVAYIVSIAIAIVVIILAIVYYKKLDKQAVMHGPAVGSEQGKGRVFSKPDSQDIFDI